MASFISWAQGDQSLYTPEMSQKTYQRLLELGLALAKAGYTVILDAKYDRQSLRQTAIKQTMAAAIPLQILHCTAPQDILEARLSSRFGDIADATVAVLKHQSMDAFAANEQPLVITIDTTADLSHQIAAIVVA
jgi:predicted kinase